MARQRLFLTILIRNTATGWRNITIKSEKESLIVLRDKIINKFVIKSSDSPLRKFTLGVQRQIILKIRISS